MSTEKKVVILVVEDNEDIQYLYHRDLTGALNGNVEILSARTVREAEGIFRAEYHRLSLVLMDGNLSGGGRSLDTIPLIEWMRGWSSELPIVATSNFPGHRERMMQAGCSHELPQKEKVVSIVTKILSPK